jgi:hypothetical protein
LQPQALLQATVGAEAPDAQAAVQLLPPQATLVPVQVPVPSQPR